jgi:hypothetical protein
VYIQTVNEHQWQSFYSQYTDTAVMPTTLKCAEALGTSGYVCKKVKFNFAAEWRVASLSFSRKPNAEGNVKCSALLTNVLYTLRNFTTLNARTGKVKPRSRTDVKACWISAAEWGNAQFDVVALSLPVASASEVGGAQLVDTGYKKRWKKGFSPRKFSVRLAD